MTVACRLTIHSKTDATSWGGLILALGAMRLIIATLLFLLPSFASAEECTCNVVSASPLEWVGGKWQGSTFVFVGQVTSVAPPLPNSNEVRDQPTVTVLQSYKGNFPGGELRGAECGSAALPGESAMFFVDGYNRIKSCSIGVLGLTEQQIQKAVLEFSRRGT
jgi:hypothetical protein